MNTLINILKVGLIWLTDFINKTWEPWVELTRPTDMKYYEHLEEKATKFEQHMLEKFHVLGDRFWTYKLPVDSGDQCLWHGVYTAMWAIKYSMTNNDVDLGRLKDCVKGLFAHQLVTEPTVEPHPARLVRGYREDGSVEDNVSNDQATGHLLGIYFLWKYGDADCRYYAKGLIEGLANELLENKCCLVDANGKPTPHGKLVNGYLTDPLNLTLCLAIFRVGWEITNKIDYLRTYCKLSDKYRLLIPYANVRLLWLEKTHHAHRAAIHYSILCDLEKSYDLHRKYLKGLIRTWNMEKKSVNVWIYYLVRRHVLIDPAYVTKSLQVLQEFTLEDKKERIFKESPDLDSFQYGKHKRVREILPKWQLYSQDFFWQRHLHATGGTVEMGREIGLEHNGGDFLVAYWGLRSLRLIGGDE